MKKYKKLLVSLVFVLLLVVSVLLGVNFNKEETYSEDEPKQVKQEKTLSMMIEQTEGAGDYEMEERTSWPTKGYKFNATLSKCENGSTLSWDDTNNVVTMTGNMSDKCYIYFDIFNPKVISDVCSAGDGLSSCITKLGNVGNSSSTNLYYHDSSLTNGAGDNSYRYSGASEQVNNYVCFGANYSPCPSGLIFRIIGVFDEKVKLITADYSSALGTDGDYTTDTYSQSSVSTYKGDRTTVNRYYWNFNASGNSSNTWSTSLLNTTNLNNNFYYVFSKLYTKSMSGILWKVGGNSSLNIYDKASVAYTNEITNPADSTTYSDEIGLMYVSDYGFAASPSAWTLSMNNYNNIAESSNWLYLGMNEWTITRNSDGTNHAYNINENGAVSSSDVGNAFAVRPVLYLSSVAEYKSGDGTIDSPIYVKPNEGGVSGGGNVGIIV